MRRVLEGPPHTPCAPHGLPGIVDSGHDPHRPLPRRSLPQGHRRSWVGWGCVRPTSGPVTAVPKGFTAKGAVEAASLTQLNRQGRHALSSVGLFFFFLQYKPDSKSSDKDLCALSGGSPGFITILARVPVALGTKRLSSNAG